MVRGMIWKCANSHYLRWCLGNSICSKFSNGQRRQDCPEFGPLYTRTHTWLHTCKPSCCTEGR